jgi:hypothetical protein
MHTLKSQLITDQNGEIIQIDAGYGRTAHRTLGFIGTRALKTQWLRKPKLGDKAYVGEDIETPRKKPKGGLPNGR